MKLSTPQDVLASNSGTGVLSPHDPSPHTTTSYAFLRDATCPPGIMGPTWLQSRLVVAK
jgi:hypothetical protein